MVDYDRFYVGMNFGGWTLVRKTQEHMVWVATDFNDNLRMECIECGRDVDDECPEYADWKSEAHYG